MKRHVLALAASSALLLGGASAYAQAFDPGNPNSQTFSFAPGESGPEYWDNAAELPPAAPPPPNEFASTPPAGPSQSEGWSDLGQPLDEGMFEELEPEQGTGGSPGDLSVFEPTPGARCEGDSCRT
jgi:hypothetical protein